MYLIVIWSLFIFFIGLTKLDYGHYFIFSFFMFYVTYIANQVKPVKMNLRSFCFLISIPSSIFCWIGYVYNYLLKIEPLDETFVIFSIFFYFYLLIFFFFFETD